MTRHVALVVVVAVVLVVIVAVVVVVNTIRKVVYHVLISMINRPKNMVVNGRKPSVIASHLQLHYE